MLLPGGYVEPVRILQNSFLCMFGIECSPKKNGSMPQKLSQPCVSNPCVRQGTQPREPIPFYPVESTLLLRDYSSERFYVFQLALDLRNRIMRSAVLTLAVLLAVATISEGNVIQAIHDSCRHVVVTSNVLPTIRSNKITCSRVL